MSVPELEEAKEQFADVFCAVVSATEETAKERIGARRGSQHSSTVIRAFLYRFQMIVQFPLPAERKYGLLDGVIGFLLDSARGHIRLFRWASAVCPPQEWWCTL